MGSSSEHTREPIAIVGSGCRFPGNANTTAKLWQMLQNPTDLVQTLPETRFNPNGFYHPDGKRHGCTNAKTAYLLSEAVDRFDATFFNTNPREAEAIDPQQRMLLEVVFEAMESAGFTIDGMRGSNTSVHVGSMTGDYAKISQHDPDTMPQYTATGTASSIISNRVSYFFDWKGLSQTIDTACSSSLVAVHHAVQALRSGDSDTAVAGGTNLILSPDMFISESKLQMLSPTGRSRMWDAKADGYARGEGFAVILLKRLGDAIADGDHIECVIRETGVNQDGRTKGITMPSADSQTKLIRRTYERAGLDWRNSSERCQYFEAHGTGTQAGDVIEAQGVADAFFQDGQANGKAPLYIGSVKTVIGHLEGCAGLAGLLKASLAIQSAAIPPNRHFDELNSAIHPYYRHLEIPTTLREWPAIPGNVPRRASVNSFGFGGTNAHAILESMPESTAVDKWPADGRSVLTTPIVLSAMSQYSLTEVIRTTRDFIHDHPNMDLEEVAWNLQTRRSQFPLRVAFAGTSHTGVLAQMASVMQQNDHNQQVPVGIRMLSNASSHRTLAVFTGQGAQWAAMGRELLLHSEAFSSTIKSLDESLSQLPDPPNWSLRGELLKNENVSRLAEAEIAQPLCTAVQIALLDLFAVAKITPDVVIGHSSGEIAAAYAVRAISARNAIRIAYYRGAHTRHARGALGQKGAMMAAGISYDEAESFCSQSQFENRINVAAANSHSSVTLAGDQDAIALAKSALDDEGRFARLLKVDKAYHSPHMLPCVGPYASSLRACNINVRKPSTSCLWYSSVHGRLMNTDCELQALTGDYWVDNMTSPVLFAQTLEGLLRDQEHPISVAMEFGPHSALKGPVLQTWKEVLGHNIPYQGILTRGVNDAEAFSAALGFLWSHVGLPVGAFDDYRRTFSRFNDWTPCFLPELPGYCWDHQRSFWSESRLSKNYRGAKYPRHDLLGRPGNDNTALDMRWRNVLRLGELPWLEGHRVQGSPIFPAAGYLVMALEASKEMVKGQQVAMIELLDVSLVASIDLYDSQKGKEMQFALTPTASSDSNTEAACVVADFACYSCVDDNSDTWEKNVSGKVRLTLGGAESGPLAKRCVDLHSLVSVNISNFYDVMDEIGLNYTGMFRGLSSIRRKMGFATATASLPGMTEESSDMIIHPALLDSCFQALFAAYCWPGDGSLHNPFVPTEIHRICVSSSFANLTSTEKTDLTVDAYLTESSSAKLRADLEIMPAEYSDISVLIEGLTATSLVPAGPHDDHEVFSKTVWDVDISSGVTLFNESEMDSPEDIQQIEVCERLAYYYFRRLRESIPSSEIATFKWHHQRLFEYIDHLSSQVRRGEHPIMRMDWSNDTYEELSNMKRPFDETVDVQLTTAVGENLPRIVRGEIPALEVMLENNMLDRLYKHGVGFPRGNRIISRMVQQITHRNADMNILEIGAGTGGATSIILRTIGHSFSSYTFSDISAGFFENAQATFKEFASKMKFKALDIEGDLAEQRFERGSFDTIVASNVLHATKSLEQTLRNVRYLLRPGGYLILLEVTSDILRIKLMMSGLPGWWLGGEDERRFAPTVSQERWNSLLRTTGFSGVDTIAHDMNDASKHITSGMLSQATDDNIWSLRAPLTSSGVTLAGKVLAIGGMTSSSKHLVREASEMLSHRISLQNPAKVLPSLEDVNTVDLTEYSTVLCMADFDRPVFCSMTRERLAAMQKLFEQANVVLWVTSGGREDNPYSSIAIGLGRSLHYEFPQLELQFLDIGEGDLQTKCVGRVIAESLLRLAMKPDADNASKQRVWTTERELALEDSRLLIPRVTVNNELNRRLNARRRVIKESVSPTRVPVELVSMNGKLELLPIELASQRKTVDPCVRIQVRHSTPYALRVCDHTFLFLCEGEVVEGSDVVQSVQGKSRFLALSTRNSSIVDVPVGWVFACGSVTENWPYRLRACAVNMMVANMDLEHNAAMLIHEPDPLTMALVVDLLNLRGIRVMCTTTNADAAQEHDWVHVHAHCTDRQLRGVVPADIDIFWNQSLDACPNEIAGRIQKSLPRVARSYSWNGFQKETSHVEPWSSADEISQVFTLACRALPADNTFPGLDIDMLPIQDLETAKPLLRSIVSWRTEGQLLVRVQPVNTKNLFRPDKTYLMVGCTGGLGLSLCRWMAENGARYLALTSRHPERVDSRWTEDMRKMGVQIEIIALDVSDMQGLQRVYHDICSRFPSIAGVANAAMVLDDKAFSGMSLESLLKVLRPKVDGTRNLDELFPTKDLDFFVLFSSTSSVMGNRGQSNYAAANLFMVALANNRKKRGLAASVIDIGMVLGVGYVTENGIYESKLRRQNFMPISEAEFHNMFAEAVVAGRPGSGKSIQLTTGLHRARRSDGDGQAFWVDNPRFSHMLQEDDSETTADPQCARAIPVKELLEQATTEDERKQILEDCFLSKLGRILQVPTDAIEKTAPLISLGVDSLMAVEVRTWFTKELDVDVSVLKVLGGSSLADLCKHASDELSNLSETGGDQPDTASERKPIPTPRSTNTQSESIGSDEEAHEDPASVATTPPSTPSPSRSPGLVAPKLSSTRIERMSYAQRRLWFLIKYVEDPSSYNVTLSYRLTKPLRPNHLRAAFQIVIQRHESLRTCFFTDEATSEPMQAILPTADFDVETLQTDEVEGAIDTVRNHRYALAHGETLKAVLTAESPSENYLIIGFSHIVLDGFSAQTVIRELQQAYTSPQKLLSLPPPEQYLDFAVRQHLQVESGKMASDIAFWKGEYPDMPRELPLLPFARVETRKSLRRYDTHFVQTRLNAGCVKGIARLSKNLKSTTFIFYVAALQTLLFKFLGSTDLCIGISDANRAERESLGIVGFLVNLLPVRLRCLAQETFEDVVKAAARKVHDAIAHSRLPFDILLDELSVPRSATESPMFQVLLDYQKGPELDVVIGDSRAELHSMQDARNGIDLTVEIKEVPGQDATVTIRSQQYLYHPQGLQLLLASYCHILETASNSPQIDLEQLPAFEQSTIDRALEISGQQHFSLEPCSETVADRISQAVLQYPDECALKDGLGNSLTYAELGSRADIVAAELQRRGAHTGGYVAVCCEPSFACICSILAIYQVGATYVPLDIRNSPHRTKVILGECPPTTLVHDDTTVGHLRSLACYSGTTLNLSSIEFENRNSAHNAPSLSKPNFVAYVLYTSGSTGVPKGVLVSHSNLICQLDAMRLACNLQRETVLQQSSLGFDASIDQIFGALAFGGTLVLVPRRAQGDATEMARLMLLNNVTMSQMTPSEYSALLTYGSNWLQKCSSWKFAFCGGESFTSALQKQFSSLSLGSLSVYNRYGPTEVTVSSCLAKVPLCMEDPSRNERIPCGAPLKNYSMYILDDKQNPLPLGFPGEICVGGGGVSRGYLNNKAAEDEKFIPNQFASREAHRLGWGRLYRTGDKGLLSEDGSLIYLGRVEGDTQVKLHGRRIELDEIRAAILNTAGDNLTDVVVSKRTVAADNELLIAAVTFATHGIPDNTDKYFLDLSKKLAIPQYMRPSRWAVVRSLPRNINGKLDLDTLNSIPIPSRIHEVDDTLTDEEARLASIWAEVLSDDGPVSSSSDFFEIGGNSVLLLRLQSVLRERTTECPPLADLFANSTLRGMATFVHGAQSSHSHGSELNIDWEQESALLGPAFVSSSTREVRQAGLEVVLTGATGFLGSTILERCLESRTIKHVHCIAIRNENTIGSLKQRSNKIIPHHGDLRLPRLGLTPDTFSHLAQHADLIIHNAADVSFLKSYHSLRRPNVDSTKTLIQMAAPRQIPFHFISTGSVARHVPQKTLPEISISGFPPDSKSAPGYSASKWVSECVVERACEEFGIPGCVHRPTSISGSGAPVTDIMQNILHYSTKLHALPRVEGPHGNAPMFDFVTVQSVADEIMQSALQTHRPRSYEVRHHCNDVKLSPQDLKGRLEQESGGRPWEELAVSDWIRQSVGAGMPELVASMIESVLQKQAYQSPLPVLVKAH